MDACNFIAKDIVKVNADSNASFEKHDRDLFPRIPLDAKVVSLNSIQLSRMNSPLPKFNRYLDRRIDLDCSRRGIRRRDTFFALFLGLCAILGGISKKSSSNGDSPLHASVLETRAPSGESRSISAKRWRIIPRERGPADRATESPIEPANEAVRARMTEKPSERERERERKNGQSFAQ